MVRLDAVKVAVIASRAVRCEVISLRIATASLAVASSVFLWLWLAPKALEISP